MCGSMQYSPEDLKNQLLACIDEDCNVTDMAGCLTVITFLEQACITRKILEDTRLGKYVNEIRKSSKNTDHDLPKRLKNLVRKWKDVCLAENVNGVPHRGPGPGGGGNSSNGRHSISPPFSAPSSVKSQGAPGLSPCSIPSSGTTSPLGRVSIPTTPSTISQKVKNLSPLCSVAKGRLSSSNSAFKSKSTRVSPSSGKSSPITVSCHSLPTSPQLSKSVFRPIQSAKESSDEVTYIPIVDDVPRTNAANKRLRKAEDDQDSSDMPASKRPRNYLVNGFEDECSRDSVLSVVSSDRQSHNSGDAAIQIVAENVQTIQPEKPARRAGRKRKTAFDVLMGSNTPGGASALVDPLRRKMAAIGTQNAKVKTTSQLVAELAQKSGDRSLARRASHLEWKDKEVSLIEHPDRESVSFNKKEHIEKFLKSVDSTEVRIDDDDDEIIIIENESSETDQTSTIAPSSSNPTPILLQEMRPFVPLHPNPNSPVSNMDLLGIRDTESAEDILARLPAIDINSINWEEDELNPNGSFCLNAGGASSSLTDTQRDDDDDITLLAEKVHQTTIETLHNKNLDCQNGNFDMDGKFREWHEVMSQKGYQDSPVVVLPYVVTDY